jgi:hypothetical protein
VIADGSGGYDTEDESDDDHDPTEIEQLLLKGHVLDSHDAVVLLAYDLAT